MKKLLLIFCLAAQLPVMVSCNKDDDKDTQPVATPALCLLEKIYDENDSLIAELIYNSDNQYTHYKNYRSGFTYAFSYSNNKISDLTFTHHTPGPTKHPQLYDFNPEGFVKKITYDLSGTDLYFPHEYNAANQLIMQSIYAEQANGQPDELRAVEEFVYNSRNNVEKVIGTTFNYSTGETFVSSLDYEYDKWNNPLFNLRYFSSNSLYWSAELPVKVSRTSYRPDGTVNFVDLLGYYTYEFNSSNLPVKRTFTSFDGKPPVITKYAYLCR